ncbi:hypothetical protein LO763_19935 [Glycomyces sp. A-F 0318]|uniref:hypothetical protein n=1 Tax=Glycomyces amatae TaxID=2881355 RepID=UPI001E517CFD|nr:hypothetical protein [Glycomyces amatae]MCD0445884.1 hypothetical protein [Glycomyces amatae]
MTVKKTVLLEQPEAAAVHRAALEDGISDSALMARAIEDYLMRRAVDRLDAYVHTTGADALATEHRADDADDEAMA